jgi:hypothetical protein
MRRRTEADLKVGPYERRTRFDREAREVAKMIILSAPTIFASLLRDCRVRRSYPAEAGLHRYGSA